MAWHHGFACALTANEAARCGAGGLCQARRKRQMVKLTGEQGAFRDGALHGLPVAIPVRWLWRQRNGGLVGGPPRACEHLCATHAAWPLVR